MRTFLLLAALLPVAALGADETDSLDESGPEDIVVSGTRAPSSAAVTPASVSRLSADELAEIASRHQADALNRNAGVYIQRGNGAESLVAIRSPVLAGAGACGAFLVAEDSLPIRPVGFCNLNEMFELNYEQADRIEVLRGPGSALFGASAVHGIVNVLTPDPKFMDAFTAGVEGGADSFKRVRFGAGHDFGTYSDPSVGIYGVATRAPGWRADSGVDEAKLNLLTNAYIGGGNLRVRASGTVLNQETAGFIQGFDSYRNDALARSNPNPEAFRDASSARVATHYDFDDTFGEGSKLETALLYRRSRMDFSQHFLVGKPLEHNAQTSYYATAAATVPWDEVTLRVEVDGESARSELTEFQSGPATDGTPAANAIRPAGFHYDYTVDSWTAGTSLGVEYRPVERFTASATLRVDQTTYDYDNHMLAGNTDQNGVRCGVAGCLYARPADRDDSFHNVAPRVTLAWRPTWSQLVYVNASTGYRPPEMTEMYRLQRQQSVADLDSERLDSVEAGWKIRGPGSQLSLAVYEMNKRHVILRDTNGFNVSNGSTRHRGIEYELTFRPRLFALPWQVAFTGSVARHQYTFSRSIEGGETIIDGNDVDTAPRNLHNVSVSVPFGATEEFRLGINWNYVGAYFLDAANTAKYPGHQVTGLSLSWRAPRDLRLHLSVDNVFDTAYADRADFAFGNYRYFPGRGRAAFLSVDYTHE
ncbi:MAG TPA: TonB-dependent receptor [Steroidobacteraceae bacterium]|nr:TonB-dependent receptor [Steroidobacteraceae bacterium]